MANQEYLSKEGLVSYDTQLKVVVDNKVKVAKDAADAAKIAADGAKQKAETNTTSIGSLGDLTTEAKTNVVGAINELVASVGNAQDAGKITVETAGTPSSGAVKSYVVKQNGKQVGKTIDIPTDLVVKSGEVKTYTVQTLPTGEGAPTSAGTYLVLTLSNEKHEKVYINVGTLVDIYKAKATASGDKIQVTVDNSKREISASVVAGSIGATELATNAVTTVKIADGNVSKEKLAEDVQTSLRKADTAVQSVKTGTTNGTVSVDRTDVAVKGLGSAAYTASTAYEKAGAVKALADGQVTTNKNDIASLKTKVTTLEGTTYTPISDEDIKAIVNGTYKAS